MRIEDLIETDWFDAFVAEHTTSPRHEIVKTVNRYLSRAMAAFLSPLQAHGTHLLSVSGRWKAP
jgi:hypothetical protein